MNLLTHPFRTPSSPSPPSLLLLLMLLQDASWVGAKALSAHQHQCQTAFLLPQVLAASALGPAAPAQACWARLGGLLQVCCVGLTLVQVMTQQVEIYYASD